jgi:hypothetical protein
MAPGRTLLYLCLPTILGAASGGFLSFLSLEGWIWIPTEKMFLKCYKRKTGSLTGRSYKKLLSRGLRALVHHDKILAQLTNRLSKFQPSTGKNQ